MAFRNESKRGVIALAVLFAVGVVSFASLSSRGASRAMGAVAARLHGR